MGAKSHIVDLNKVYKEDEELVGKKAYELGVLAQLKIPIPDGFVIKTSLFTDFLKTTGIDKEISKLKKSFHPSLSDSIDKFFEPVRNKILHTHIPHEQLMDLHSFYKKLAGVFREATVNITFSSFKPNRLLEFTEIKGDANVFMKIKTIWASFFNNPGAIIISRNIKAKIKGKTSTNHPVSDQRLTEQQKNKLIEYCKIIQKHFYFPKDIEYAVVKSKVIITKISPFTGTVDKILKQAFNTKAPRILARGISINFGIATGPVKIFRKGDYSLQVKKGEIIVLPALNKPFLKKIKNAKAVIIDAVLQSNLDRANYRRHFHAPTIEGIKNALKLFHDGNVVTVNAAKGEIYSGGLIC